MGGLSIWHWLIVLLVVVLIFGTKKLRNIGQDLGGAVKGFKEGMKTPEEAASARRRCAAAVADSRQDDRRRSEEGNDEVVGARHAAPRGAVIMFDIGFSEIVVIAVVALIVIGPERLPKAARTMGHLFGRLQRYVNDVKADINREIELDELRKLQKEVQTAASELKSSVESAAQDVETGVRDVERELNAAGHRARNGAPCRARRRCRMSRAASSPMPHPRSRRARRAARLRQDLMSCKRLRPQASRKPSSPTSSSCARG